MDRVLFSRVEGFSPAARFSGEPKVLDLCSWTMRIHWWDWLSGWGSITTGTGHNTGGNGARVRGGAWLIGGDSAETSATSGLA